MPRSIVLASSSRYRQEMLARLRVPFAVEVPAVDESALADEEPAATALRLSLLKARTAAQRHPGAIVIGADQVAELDGRSIGKPGGHAAARAQLRAMSGRTVAFHSGIALVDAADGRSHSECITTHVSYRQLDDAAIEAYLLADRPYDCAGSAKIESLAICLVTSVRCDDPTALIGLPLIALTSMLGGMGVHLPLAEPGAH
jgi:septum formation protein